MGKSLIGSYHMAVELLKKREMNLLATHALHELGNLQWLEGDKKGAGVAWAEGVDVCFQFYECLKNWHLLVQPPKLGENRVTSNSVCTNPFELFAADYYGSELYDQHKTENDNNDVSHVLLKSSDVYAEQEGGLLKATPIAPPTTPDKVEIMLLACLLIYKHNAYITSGKALRHVHGALFVHGVLERLLHAVPHPVDFHAGLQDTLKLTSLKYRLREVFLGYQPASSLLPPNSCHGGVDGKTFLEMLEFSMKALHVTRYQVSNALVLGQVHRYVSTDVCRHLSRSVRGKLYTARTLLLMDEYGGAFQELFNVYLEQDLPLFPAGARKETLDVSAGCNAGFVRNAASLSAENIRFKEGQYEAFVSSEGPYSAQNLKAVEYLKGWCDGLDSSAGEEAVKTRDRTFGNSLNYYWFLFLKAEFLVRLGSYKCVPFASSAAAVTVGGSAEGGEAAEGKKKNANGYGADAGDFSGAEAATKTEQLAAAELEAYKKGHEALLISGETVLKNLARAMIQSDGGLSDAAKEALAAAVDAPGAVVGAGGEASQEDPEGPRQKGRQALVEWAIADVETCELFAEIRLLLSKVFELRGMLGAAVLEVLYAQLLLQSQAARAASQAAGGAKTDTHVMGKKSIATRSFADVKYWNVLRCRLCELLTAQGRLAAAQKQVEVGLKECERSSDALAQMELLFYRAKTQLQEGRILELTQSDQQGCIPTLLELLRTHNENFPKAQPSVIVVRAKLLLFTVLRQNPLFMEQKYLFATKAVVVKDVFGREAELTEEERTKQLLEAHSGKITVSPVAKELEAILGLARKEAVAASAGETAVGGVSSSSASSGSNSGSKPNETVGGSSSSSSSGGKKRKWPSVSQRDSRKQEFLVLLLKECIQDMDTMLAQQGFDVRGPRDRNHLCHFAESAIKDKEFLALLPNSHASLVCGESGSGAWRALEPGDSRARPNVYPKLFRMRAIALLELAELKLETVTTVSASGPTGINCFGSVGYVPGSKAVSFAAEHTSNCNYRYLLEATSDLQQVENAFPRLAVGLPPRYFAKFCQLKLRWRRLVCLEHRIGRPGFESVDPNLEYALRDGLAPLPLEPIYRTFLKRAREAGLGSASDGLRSLTVPAFRWWRDDLAETLGVFLREARSVLRVAAREGGGDRKLLRGLMYECLLELLSSWEGLGRSVAEAVLEVLQRAIVAGRQRAVSEGKKSVAIRLGGREFADFAEMEVFLFEGLEESSELAGERRTLSDLFSKVPGLVSAKTASASSDGEAGEAENADKPITPEGGADAAAVSREGAATTQRISSAHPVTFDQELEALGRKIAERVVQPLKQNFLSIAMVLFAALVEAQQRAQKLNFSQLEVARGNPDGGPAGPAKFLRKEEFFRTCGGRQVELDLVAHLKRQSREGGLEVIFGGEPDTHMPSATAVCQHLLALRKECESVGFLEEELVCLADSMHMILASSLPSYGEVVAMPVERLDGVAPLSCGGAGEESGGKVEPVDNRSLARELRSSMQKSVAALCGSAKATSSSSEEDSAAKISPESAVAALSVSESWLSAVGYDGLGLDAGNFAPGTIFAYWTSVAESTPLDYPEDGMSLLLFVVDFRAVFRCTGFIRRRDVKRLYDRARICQRNARSPVLDGFERGYVEGLLAEIGEVLCCRCAKNYLPDSWAEHGLQLGRPAFSLGSAGAGSGSSSGQSGSSKPGAGESKKATLTDKARAIGTEQRTAFQERASAPQDQWAPDYEDNVEAAREATRAAEEALASGGSPGGEEANGGEPGVTEGAESPGGDGAAAEGEPGAQETAKGPGVEEVTERSVAAVAATSRRESAQLPKGSDIADGAALLVESIGFNAKFDAYTGESSETEVDLGVLKVDTTRACIDAMASLLNCEAGACTATHAEVAKFLMRCMNGKGHQVI